MNIWAVGRNYGAHAKELGNDIPKTPLIFLKAGSCAVPVGPVKLWSFSQDIHHEVEIAFRFSNRRDSKGFLEFDAVAIALDLTARDIQNELKKQMQPWTLAKSFTGSLPISSFVAIPPQPPHFRFQLKVNGELRQQGDTHDMIFNFEMLRTYVQERFPVEPGDILITGTPSGVAALRAGDTAYASLHSESGHELTAEWRFE